MRLKVLAGSAYGETATVPVASPQFLVDVHLEAGTTLELQSEHEERAVYVVDGSVACGGATIGARTMGVARPRVPAILEAAEPAHVVLLGGESLGPRFIWWNFVASTADRIEEAARAWKERRFPVVPGDEVEFIPLHDSPRFASPAV